MYGGRRFKCYIERGRKDTRLAYLPQKYEDFACCIDYCDI